MYITSGFFLYIGYIHFYTSYILFVIAYSILCIGYIQYYTEKIRYTIHTI